MSGRHPRKGERGWRSRSGAAARSGPSGKKRSLFQVGEFVAVDGEGLSAPDFRPQRYALLSLSTGDELIDPKGIPTARALALLVRIARRNPRAIFVCFGASYDCNQLLRDLSHDEIAALWSGLPVDWRRWRIEYRPRKSLVVREWNEPRFVRSGGVWRASYAGSFTLWDVFGFFQSSFVEALSSWLTEGERKSVGYSEIVAGKARRSQFRAAELPSIRSYTRAELRALVLLMERLREHLREAALPVARWDGAGAVAATMLTRHGVKEHLRDMLPEIERAARHAYSGGRIEVVRYGTLEGPCFHYDLNAAYPSAMVELPSLAGGAWHAHPACERSARGFAMLRVRWQLAARRGPEAFPFFYRERWGDICYPPDGEAWCWWPEYEAADELLRLGVYQGSITVLGGWCFHPASEARPFAFVPELHRRRQEWKAEGRGAEKVLKLGTNSLYGKLAQQVGYSLVREGDRSRRKRPPFHNLAYAGYITARTRAVLLRAAMARPAGLIMFATDAVFASTPLDLPVGTALGTWTEKVHRAGIVIAQSGVYWTRDREPGSPFVHEQEYRRGFDKDSLGSGFVRAAWRARAESIEAQATRFVTMGSALDGGGDPWCQDGECPQTPRPHRLFSHWRTWRTVPRELRIDPRGTKRTGDPAHTWRSDPPHLSLVPTLARVVPHPDEQHERCPLGCVGSHPYALRWAGEEDEENRIDGANERIFDQEVEDARI